MRSDILVSMLLGGLALGGLAADLIPQVVKGFRYPDYDAQGQLKYEIMGDEARVQPDGTIVIANLKLVLYEAGKAVTHVTAPRCVFDRVKRTASSTSEVCVARSEIVLTGRGFEWQIDAGRLNILSQARVILQRLPRPEMP